MPVVKIYRGLPTDARDSGSPWSVLSSTALVNWRFLLAFLLILVCFIIILLAVFCVRRRRRPTEDVSTRKKNEK